MNIDLPFSTRLEAGHTLSKHLERYKGVDRTVILALVRGGVVVAQALADDLQLPMYPYIVRKIGHPDHREFGVGAIAEGGEVSLEPATLELYGIDEHDLESVVQEETQELNRRKLVYAADSRPPLAGKTVILTDDGAATGSTLFAAIKGLRKQNVSSIIVALPVCPPDTAERLRNEANLAIILHSPEPFNAVGQWYLDFPQVEDADVIDTLKVERSRASN